jgi:mannose-1-phosphate guanylyltransferase
LHESERSSTRADDGLWAVVLAGGIGSRFWPASTRHRPKQLLALASDQPLIADTVERAEAVVDPSRLRILAGEELAVRFRSVLPEFPLEGYWVEPAARGTAPVLAWAAWEIHRRDPDAVMISLHADHRIRPLGAFSDTLAAAAAIAREEDVLVCVGAHPTRPETGYGYLEPGDALTAPGGVRAHRVRAFHEKPDAATAAAYLEHGHLWNTGIFVWKVETFLSEVRRHAPELAACLPLLEKGADAFFAEVPVSVVDTEIMERSDRVATVEALFDWDDVGSWEALTRTLDRDSGGNVSHGDAVVLDGSGNVIYADDGQVVVIGVDDLVVVRTEDRTLVIPRERAADLKTYLDRMREAGDA